MRARYAVAAATVVICGITAAAAAASGPDDSAAAGKPRHCVTDVESQAERCFDDYRSAMSFATGGAIDDAPLDAREAVGDATLAARVRNLAERGGSATGGVAKAAVAGEGAEATVVAATLFSGSNYTGDSETIRTAKPCAKDGHYDYGYTLGSMTRKIRSVQPWANCWIWLHEGDNFDSARQGPFKTDTPDLGDWNDRAVLLGLS